MKVDCINMNDKIIVRSATAEDADTMLSIYTPYVTETAITFEYDVPSIEEFTNRIHQVQKKYPWLAAEIDGKVVGYAYAGSFKERAAYGWAVEISIYVKQDQKRKGIGIKLYIALETCLIKQGILNVNSCIAYPEKEDEYLTKDSVRFHEKLGFKKIGIFHNCGYKFNRWYHMIWMEKMIGKHVEHQPEVIPFPEIESRQ